MSEEQLDARIIELAKQAGLPLKPTSTPHFLRFSSKKSDPASKRFLTRLSIAEVPSYESNPIIAVTRQIPDSFQASIVPIAILSNIEPALAIFMNLHGTHERRATDHCSPCLRTFKCRLHNRGKQK